MAAEREKKLPKIPDSISKHDLSELYKAWEGFKQVPFPSAARGQEVGGVDLVLIHSKLADCIQIYLDRGLLDWEKANFLEDCMHERERVLPLLLGDAAAYFERLYDFGLLILGEVQFDYMGGVGNIIY